MDATEIAAQVRDGRLSPRAVVDRCLAQIAVEDPAIGAFQVVDVEGARRTADALANRADIGTLPLAGVPVAIKDNVAVAALPTRHGSAATSTSPAPDDDELVRRLRAAGAIVVGKTRLPELAIWPFTESPALGGTRNPRDPARNAGGSTGGGAAAVAAGMVPLALGSDGGGSLRIPAANCGVVGLKPGRGTLSTAEHWYGCTAYGPIAATVADAALALDVLAGTDRFRGVRPVDRRLRVAVSLRSPSPLARPDATAKASVAQAVELARLAGHAVRDASPPYPATLINAWARYWYAGVALDAQQLGLDVARLEPRTRKVIRKGARRPDPDVARAWRDRVLGWFENYDVLLMPVIARPAPLAGEATRAGFLSAYLSSARSIPYTQAWNFAGLPALSLPMGGTATRPGAVQIVAPDEETVLRVASQLEQAGSAAYAATALRRAS
jgi:amidase